MWARVVGFVGLFLAAFALQTTVAPHLALAGTPPDLILVAVVTLGLLRGTGSGAASGMAAGLALDLLRGRQLGLFAFGLGAAGCLAGMVSSTIYPSRVSVRFAIALAATLLDQLLVVGFYTLSRGDLDLLAVGLLPAVRQALYNGVLTVLVYGPLSRVARSREAFRL